MNRTLPTIAIVCLTLGATCLIQPRSVSAQGPTDFLKRLDANGNGMLDPAETEGRMGEFIKRMAASNPRLDVSRPIPLSRLTEEFQRMREQRTGGGGDASGRGGPGGSRGGPQPGGGPGGTRGGPQPGGRGGDQNQRGGDRSRGNEQQSNPYEYRNTEIEPLVPSFGEEDLFTPPLGFGAEGELFTVEVSEEDRQAAEKSFQYYDRNHDGKVDSEEIKRSRYGADLKLYDRNRDGNITLNEMQYRYARRRVENERDGKSSTASRKRKEEEKGTQWAVREDERASYRVQSALERLPEGLPDWFARNDADGDGQIMMSEFSTSWSDSVLAEFAQFDLTGDGLITPQECLKATASGVLRGSSSEVASADTSASSEEHASSSDNESTGDESGGESTSSSTPAVATSAIKIDPRYLSYYQKLITKYDTNGDGHLGPSEWGSMSKSPEAADADGNKLISVEEYARWSMQR